MNQHESVSKTPSAIRVLHVISTLDPKAGGPATAIMGLALAQAHAGLDVRVAATYGEDFDDRFAKQLREASIRVELIGPARGPLARHSGIKPALADMIEKADIVHVHALWEEIQHQACRLARSSGKPYIITPHGMLDPWSLAQSRWKKRLYMSWRLRQNLKQATAIHFTTTIERNLAEPLKLGTASIVEPNGLDLAEFDTLPERGTFRRQQGISEDQPIVVFLSRVHHKKGLDLLIPAFAQAKHPEALLVIVGPGEPTYINELCEIASKHGVAECVRFTGMLHGQDRIAAFADADLFALTSRQENFGIAVAEALAAGTPVLISDQVNIAEQITDAQVGQVVPMEISTIATALDRWLADEPMRQAAAAKARPFVQSRYDWNQIAKRWLEHYAALVP